MATETTGMWEVRLLSEQIRKLEQRLSNVIAERDALRRQLDIARGIRR